MKIIATKRLRAGEKPVAGSLRLATDNLSAEDKELLNCFHAIDHQYRGTVVDIVRGVSRHRPLVEPAAEAPPPGIRLVSARTT